MLGLQALPCLSTMDLVYLGARLLWSISQCIIDLGLVIVYNGLYWCPSTMVYFAMHSRCCSTHHRWLTLPLLVHTMTLLAKAAHFPHNFDKDKLSDGLLRGLLCLYCLICYTIYLFWHKNALFDEHNGDERSLVIFHWQRMLFNKSYYWLLAFR